MEKILLMIAGIGLGSLLTFLIMGSDRIYYQQKGYIEGRNSVLSQTITLHGPETCQITIPLHVIEELIETGLLSWHELCLREYNNENQN